jgi:nucleotide-binding universal stress UspA family protein
MVYAGGVSGGMEYRVQYGNPATEILSVAVREKCDMIIMGTHGRNGIDRVLLGSIAEEVMRNAPCPVLTVKVPLLNHLADGPDSVDRAVEGSIRS